MNSYIELGDPNELYKLHTGHKVFDDSGDSYSSLDEEEGSENSDIYRPPLYTLQELEANLVKYVPKPEHHSDQFTQEAVETPEQVVDELMKSWVDSNYCYICQADLPNVNNAQSHYGSIRHANNLHIWKKDALHKARRKLEEQVDQFTQEAVETSEQVVDELMKLWVDSNYCYICQADLPNVNNAQSHYGSMRHANNLHIWKKDALHKARRKLKEQVEKPAQPVIESPEQLVENLLVSLENSDFCYICEATLPNDHNAQSHYNSRRHKINSNAFKEYELSKAQILEKHSDMEKGANKEHAGKIHNEKQKRNVEDCNNATKPNQSLEHYKIRKDIAEEIMTPSALVLEIPRVNIVPDMSNKNKLYLTEKARNQSPKCYICNLEFVSADLALAHHDRRHAPKADKSMPLVEPKEICSTQDALSRVHVASGYGNPTPTILDKSGTDNVCKPPLSVTQNTEYDNESIAHAEKNVEDCNNATKPNQSLEHYKIRKDIAEEIMTSSALVLEIPRVNIVPDMSNKNKLYLIEKARNQGPKCYICNLEFVSVDLALAHHDRCHAPKADKSIPLVEPKEICSTQDALSIVHVASGYGNPTPTILDKSGTDNVCKPPLSVTQNTEYDNEPIAHAEKISEIICRLCQLKFTELQKLLDHQATFPHCLTVRLKTDLTTKGIAAEYWMTPENICIVCLLCNSALINSLAVESHLASDFHLSRYRKWIVKQSVTPQDSDRKWYYCDICELSLVGLSEVSYHDTSITHINQLTCSRTEQQNGDQNAVSVMAKTKKNRCYLCSVTFPTVDKLALHCETSPHKYLIYLKQSLVLMGIGRDTYWIINSNSKILCTLCNQLLGNERILVDHIMASEHRKNYIAWLQKQTKDFKGPNAKWFYCKTCQVTLDGTTNAENHYADVSHLRTQTISATGVVQGSHLGTKTEEVPNLSVNSCGASSSTTDVIETRDSDELLHKKSSSGASSTYGTTAYVAKSSDLRSQSATAYVSPTRVREPDHTTRKPETTVPIRTQPSYAVTFAPRTDDDKETLLDEVIRAKLAYFEEKIYWSKQISSNSAVELLTRYINEIDSFEQRSVETM